MSNTVKALLADSPKGHFKVGTIARKSVEESDVEIEIYYAGICHSDLHNVLGEWGGYNYYPMVPGHEIAGVVKSVGKKVKKFKIGDRVGVGCMVESCRNCEMCNKGEEQLCKDGMILTYNALLTEEHLKKHKMTHDMKVTYGGYSEKVVVEERFVVRIPNDIPFEHAAPLLCAGITMYSPLAHNGALMGRKNFKVAIVGLGGLGDMGVKLAKAMGNDVSVISSSERKRDYAERILGVKYINSGRTKETLKKMEEKHGDKFDLVISTISAWHDINPYIALAKTDGTLIMVGASPEPLNVEPFPLIMGRKKIGGSPIGGMEETQEMLDFCSKHQIWSEAEVIKASEVNRAYTQLQANVGEKQRFVIDIKNSLPTLKPEQIEQKWNKERLPHKINDYQYVHGYDENVTGKTYDPKSDKFE